MKAVPITQSMTVPESANRALATSGFVGGLLARVRQGAASPRFSLRRDAGSLNFLALLSAQWLAAVVVGLHVRHVIRSGSPLGHWLLLDVILIASTVLSCAFSTQLWRWGLLGGQVGDLLYRALHDSCTGLPNRAAIEVTLEEWIEKDEAVSCLFIEVDKVCATEHVPDGASAESLAKSVPLRLQRSVSNEDLLGCMGTNRFVLLVNRPHTRADLAMMARNIIAAMAQPVPADEQPFTASVSIGISSFPADASGQRTLLAAAKHAMSTSRNEEPNHFRFADHVCALADRRNSMLSGKLQRALRDDVLQLVYQPIYGKSQQIVALEALARWRDLEEGPISPNEFVPVAEANGMIGPLSDWVLRQACTQMAEWISLGFPLERVAVNVSVKQVWRSDFVATVQRILQETELNASNLELELTEGALATDFERVKQNLQSLRQLGVRISIDDFGVGYSSLSRVRELNADVLKIDRVFVQGANASHSGAAMVQAIIDMAHSLNLSVIAEGVETRDQLDLLRRMSCDEIQGFFLSRPQAAEVLTAELRAAHAPASHVDSPMQLNPRVA